MPTTSAELEFRSALESFRRGDHADAERRLAGGGAGRAAPCRRAQSARRFVGESATLPGGRAVPARGDEDSPASAATLYNYGLASTEFGPPARRARRLRQGADEESAQRRRLVRARKRAAGKRRHGRGDRLLRPRAGDRPQLPSRARQQGRGAAALAAILRVAAQPRNLSAPQPDLRRRAPQQGRGSLQPAPVRPRAWQRRDRHVAWPRRRQGVGNARQHLSRAGSSRRGDRQHWQGDFTRPRQQGMARRARRPEAQSLRVVELSKRLRRTPGRDSRRRRRFAGALPRVPMFSRRTIRRRPDARQGGDPRPAQRLAQ